MARSASTLCRLAALSAGVALAYWPGHASAQQQQPSTDQPTFTLHVYNNLVQFPTIVLNKDDTPLPPIPRDKFAITIDGGPPFHPTQMRREGDDPISLAVVLDASGSQPYLIDHFSDDFARLMPAFLHANDHVSIFAQDCNIVRTLRNQPSDGERVKAAIVSALATPDLHGPKPKVGCGDELHLWDSLILAGNDLYEEPGRRVILLVSEGDEYRSRTAFADVSRVLSARGIAVFRLRDEFNSTSMSGSGMGASHAYSNAPEGSRAVAQLSADTGGMTLNTSARHLARDLQNFIMLLRNRYIIEFPRPDDRAAGHHDIEITVPGKLLFIRNTGATTPLPDAAQQNDPNTLPSSASPAVVGNRKPLKP